MNRRNVSLAHYLFARLRQLGVGSVHGVPGDYTLRALDELKPAGFRWIGNCNELNAAYAADGYARIKKIGAVFTTYGVGELSALNAIAGSCAEQIPVVSSVCEPSRAAYQKGLPVHRSLGNGRDLRGFADIYKHFTVAQASLFKSVNVPAQIDETLTACVKESRPGYVEIPCGMVGAQLPSGSLDTPLDLTLANPSDLENNVAKSILERMRNAKQPYILVDGLVGPDDVKDEVNQFARLIGFPVFSLTHEGDIIDGTLEDYHGVHVGPYGSLGFRSYFEKSDLALLFGPLVTWSASPQKGHHDFISRKGDPD
ncbi:hypothetical protein P280DRAFT_404124 [Massarina eburnea CBS 473.64]|uniref:Pyruvate decarboxylase n=1 Tax=Massarina eburnea CBS 473.64 TaxID=1395130 RepID=A0A6A6RVB5_9PLEO|nr:hypothetical protein P280DRAFT_404124 [Massarina eburnea CBS 473.64]